MEEGAKQQPELLVLLNQLDHARRDENTVEIARLGIKLKAQGQWVITDKEEAAIAALLKSPIVLDDESMQVLREVTEYLDKNTE